MKATELRIGNITDKGIIKSFYEQGVHVGFEKTFSFNDIKPIKLTEEWLLKFGFNEYMATCDLRINIGGGVLLQFHFGVNQVECCIGDEISRTDIIYVHQLQNLYFALTQTELTTI